MASRAADPQVMDANTEEVRGKTNGSTKRENSLPTIGLDDDIMTTLVSPDRLVEGLIGEATFNVMWGSSSGGKTFMAIDLAMAITRGALWFGRKTLKSAVLYIILEGQGPFRNRINAYLKFNVLDSERKKIPFCHVEVPIDLGPDDDDDHVNRIIATAMEATERFELPVRLIVIDTMRASTPGVDENSSKDISAFVRRCRTIQKAAGAAILVVHHSGKDKGLGARGSKALTDAAEAEIEITNNDGIRQFEIKKTRDSESGQKYGFRLEQVELGTVKEVDDADKLITSCVVRPSDAEAEPTRKLRQMAKWEQALEALRAALVDNPTIPPDKRLYPTVTTFTTVKAFEAELEARGIVAANEPEEARDAADAERKKAGNMRKQHSRLREDLRKRQLYAEYKGVCWSPEVSKT